MTATTYDQIMSDLAGILGTIAAASERDPPRNSGLVEKAGTRLVEVSRTAFDVYALGDYVWDVELDYFNNIVEGGLGARLIPWTDLDLHLVAEWRRGKYLGVSDEGVIQLATAAARFTASLKACGCRPGAMTSKWSNFMGRLNMSSRR